MRICVLLLAAGFAGCAGEARTARDFDAHREAKIAALIARVLMQGLGISIQQKWWPEGSPERERLHAQRRQFNYLLDESSRPRFFRMNRDWAVRLEAMRNFRSEADVERAMLIFYHEPLERPVNWKDPYPRDE